VVVSGCAHSGICNMIEHAKKVTGVEQVVAVIGGFHLKANSLQTKRTIKHISDLNIQGVHPSHCTLDPALGMFNEAFGSGEMIVGVERIWK
jgi:7,8-dihydropterin-6-yl-methyl-4-(beta-D-ribofuranosyl)aminobenzene 5'-phosphate synthase